MDPGPDPEGHGEQAVLAHGSAATGRDHVHFNADSNARAASLWSGSVDFLWNGPPELNAVLGKDPALAIYGGKGTLTWQYLDLNM